MLTFSFTNITIHLPYHADRFEASLEHLRASMADEHDGSDTELRMLPVEEKEIPPQSKRSSNAGASRGWMGTFDEDRCESDAVAAYAFSPILSRLSSPSYCATSFSSVRIHRP